MRDLNSRGARFDSPREAQIYTPLPRKARFDFPREARPSFDVFRWAGCFFFSRAFCQILGARGTACYCRLVVGGLAWLFLEKKGRRIFFLRCCTTAEDEGAGEGEDDDDDDEVDA
jgi:hypothetical protein